MKLFPLHIVPNDTNIDFMSHRKPVLAIMVVLLLASFAIIGFKGFNYALDFTGGTVVELRFAQPAQVDGVRERLQADPGYSGLITKNPAHPLWRTLRGPRLAYDLCELAEYLPGIEKYRPKRRAPWHPRTNVRRPPR